MIGTWKLEFDGEARDAAAAVLTMKKCESHWTRDEALVMRSLIAGLEQTSTFTIITVPANWPPKAGDVWEDEKGGWWFARSSSSDGTVLVSHDHMLISSSYRMESIREERAFRKLNPRLRMRRTSDGAPQYF